jgi:hypothetical protein
MRTDVAMTIGAGVFGFALCAYIFTYATTRREPVEWQNGDLVFQTATAFPNEMILNSSASPLTNIGIVAISDQGGPTVIATGIMKVDEVPMRNFVASGKQGAISVFRIKNFTPALGEQVVAAARRQIGKPYDVFFDKGGDNIYSAELVRLSFSEVGLTLGQAVKLEKLAKGQPGFESIYAQRWSTLRECQSRNFDQTKCWAHILRQQVITPASIAADEHMAMIYTDMASAQALRPE